MKTLYKSALTLAIFFTFGLVAVSCESGTPATEEKSETEQMETEETEMEETEMEETEAATDTTAAEEEHPSEPSENEHPN
ncbi:MAG: hypothetical protein ABR572_12825 [Cryomorphaceae bacterium]